MNQSTLKRMIAARAGLLLDDPFWGVPALRLQVKEDPTCPTAWVDGQTLGYNPTFVEQQSVAQLKGLWIHEVEHCAMGHPWRRDGRDHREWNEACDRAINPVLRDAGYTLPEDALYELEPEHFGKSAEWIHARLPKRPPAGEGGGQPGGDGARTGQAPGGESGGQDQGDAQPGPGSLGEVRDAPPAPAEGQEEAGPTEEDWRQIMQQAAGMARSRGNLPAALDRAVAQTLKSRIDWRSAMRRFAQEVARADYSWVRPNSRYMAQGLYLPALRSHEVGVVAVAVDTSGSIDLVLLEQFGGEVQAFVDEIQPRRLHVFSVDAAVQREEVFERGDAVKLNPCGGGGTDFRPVFDALAKMEEPPVCLIYLTDLNGTFPETDPGIPTLWVSANERPPEIPFGELVTAA